MSWSDDPVWRVPEISEEIFAPFALAIGQAALAWNALHEAIGALYLALVHARLDDRRRWAEEYLIGMCRDDGKKRQKLRAGLELRHKNNPVVYDAVTELLAQCELLAEYRNDLVHAPLVARIDMSTMPSDRWAGFRQREDGGWVGDPDFKWEARREVVPNAYGWNKRAMNFHADDVSRPEVLLERLQSIRDQALALEKFAVKIGNNWRRSQTLPPAPVRPAWWIDADPVALRARRTKREDDRRDQLLEEVMENGRLVYRTRYAGG